MCTHPQWASSHCMRQGLAANQAGVLPHSPAHPQQSALPQLKAHAAHRGSLLSHIALVPRGECAAGPHRMSPIEGHLSKNGKHS